MATVEMTTNLRSIKDRILGLYKDFIFKYDAYRKITRPKAIRLGFIDQVNVIDDIANTLISGFNKLFSLIGTKEFELGLPIIPVIIGGVTIITSTALIAYFGSKIFDFSKKVEILEKDVLTPDERKMVISKVFGSGLSFDLGLGKIGLPVLAIGFLVALLFFRR